MFASVSWTRLIVVVFATACLACLRSMAAAQGPKTAWFQKARFGLFVHYLHSLQNTKLPWNLGDSTQWDSCVRAFNTDNFALQANATGARYVIFTVQQGDQFFCIPNRTIEKTSGYKRGTATASTDLLAKLYTSLKRYNISLMLYVTGDGVYRDAPLSIKMDNPLWRPGANGKFISDVKWVATWGNVLREISVRYKSKVRGWWVDGTYRFHGYTDSLLCQLKTSLTAGNPSAIVAFNPSPQETVVPYSRCDDYTAGEMYILPSLANMQVEGRQWHMLTFLGNDWAKPGVRFSANQFGDFRSRVFKRKGVLTVDVCVFRNGSIDPVQLSFLKTFQNLRK